MTPESIDKSKLPTQHNIRDISDADIEMQTISKPQSPGHKNTTDMRTILLNDALTNMAKKFRSNYIRTTKYTALSFVPLGIAYQFLRFSNCYFLLVVILSCISIISPISPITAINPFVFVLVVSMIREGFEDYSRYKSDKMQNG